MITKIGIVSGEILELLEQGNGVFVFGEIQSTLKRPHDLVLMSLGWLLHEGYVLVLEDPTRSCYRNNMKDYTNEASMFDLVVENRFTVPSQARVKKIANQIEIVTDKILILMEGCGGIVDLQTLEHSLNEHRDIILMGLGWLIREGKVQEVDGMRKIPLYRLQDEHVEAKFLCSV